jgi:hypothetical protein
MVSALYRDQACRPTGGGDRPSAFPRGNDGVLCAVHDSDRYGDPRCVLGYRETVLQECTYGHKRVVNLSHRGEVGER